MNGFTDKEKNTIIKVLQTYMKENKKITDENDVVEVLRGYTDFEQNQYKHITNVIRYFIKRYGEISSKSDLEDVMNEIITYDKKDYGVFTKTNILVSVITIIVVLFSLRNASESFGFFTIGVLIYGLTFAYVSRYIGLKKNIDSGYVWGYCLGIIGLFVVAIMPQEDVEDKANKEEIIKNSKYDDLEKLYKLKEKGILTEEEFNTEKQKILK